MKSFDAVYFSGSISLMPEPSRCRPDPTTEVTSAVIQGTEAVRWHAQGRRQNLYHTGIFRCVDLCQHRCANAVRLLSRQTFQKKNFPLASVVKPLLKSPLLFK